MKNFSLANLFNIIIATFIFFVLSLVFFLGFFKYPISLALSITLSLLFALTYFFISKKKFNAKRLKNKETKSVEELMIELNFFSKQNLYSTFTKAFQAQNKTVVKVNRGLYLKEDKTLIFLVFSFEGVSKEDVLKAYNMLKKEDKCLIYASFCSPETEKFIERFGGVIKLENKKNIYSLLLEASLLPKCTHILLDYNDTKKTFKNYFNKKNAKRFLSFGIILVVMSFFVYYKLYYLIFGIIFLIFSSVSLLFGKDN